MVRDPTVPVIAENALLVTADVANATGILVEPGATAIEAGNFTEGSLLVRTTVSPPDLAGWARTRVAGTVSPPSTVEDE